MLIRKLPANDVVGALYQVHRVDGTVMRSLVDDILVDTTPEEWSEAASALAIKLGQLMSDMSSEGTPVDKVESVLTLVAMYAIQLVVADHLNHNFENKDVEGVVHALLEGMEKDFFLIRRVADLDVDVIEYYVRKGAIPFMQGEDVSTEFGDYC